MACFEGGIICVPKHTQNSVALCFAHDIKCNSIEDCASGVDEKDCTNAALLTAGVKALIAIAVILAVIMIPVVYVVVRKRKKLAIIPDCMQPCWTRCLDRARKVTSAEERSTTHLAGSHSNVSHTSASRDGFTHAVFEPSTKNETRNQPRMNGKDPQYFQNHSKDALNVKRNSLDSFQQIEGIRLSTSTLNEPQVRYTPAASSLYVNAGSSMVIPPALTSSRPKPPSDSDRPPAYDTVYSEGLEQGPNNSVQQSTSPYNPQQYSRNSRNPPIAVTGPPSNVSLSQTRPTNLSYSSHESRPTAYPSARQIQPGAQPTNYSSTQSATNIRQGYPTNLSAHYSQDYQNYPGPPQRQPYQTPQGQRSQNPASQGYQTPRSRAPNPSSSDSVV